MARKLSGPAQVPNASFYTNELQSWRLFSAADIPAIAQTVSWSVATDKSPTVLAGLLNNCFAYAVESAALHKLSPPTAELRDFYSGIADKAAQLVWAMGYEIGCHEIPVDRLTSTFRLLSSASYWIGGRERFAGSIHRLLPDWVTGDPNAEARARARDYVTACHQTDIEVATEMAQWEDIRTLQGILLALPGMLSLLHKVAEAGQREFASRDASTGKNRDFLQSNLFGHLAGFHFDMFCVPPRTRDNIGERIGPSVAWVSCILTMAHDRVAGCIRPNDATEPVGSHWITRAIEGAAGLADATKSDRLADGWTLHRERWPERAENMRGKRT